MIKMHEMHEGDWVSDSDAAVRCSDCYLYPAAEECGEIIVSLWIIADHCEIIVIVDHCIVRLLSLWIQEMTMMIIADDDGDNCHCGLNPFQ